VERDRRGAVETRHDEVPMNRVVIVII
jgi:hypothetical protein